MVALHEEIDIELTENWRETVNIVEFVLDTTARYLQPIAESLLAIGDGRNKEAIPMDTDSLGRDFTCRRIDDRHFFRRRQNRPDANPARRLVHAEESERVAVARLDDRLDFRVRPPSHARPPPFWPRYQGCRSAGCRPNWGDLPTRRTPRRQPFRA